LEAKGEGEATFEDRNGGLGAGEEVEEEGDLGSFTTGLRIGKKGEGQKRLWEEERERKKTRKRNKNKRRKALYLKGVERKGEVRRPGAVGFAEEAGVGERDGERIGASPLNGEEGEREGDVEGAEGERAKVELVLVAVEDGDGDARAGAGAGERRVEGCFPATEAGVGFAEGTGEREGGAGTGDSAGTGEAGAEEAGTGAGTEEEEEERASCSSKSWNLRRYCSISRSFLLCSMTLSSCSASWRR
jgi:hypothetical protein